jgi:hypothetical protein
VTLTHTGYITGLRGWNETPVAKKVQGVDVFAQGTDVKEALDVAAEEMKAACSQ